LLSLVILNQFKNPLIARIHLTDFHTYIGLRNEVDFSFLVENDDELLVLMQGGQVNRSKIELPSRQLEVEAAFTIFVVDLIVTDHTPYENASIFYYELHMSTFECG
jgi:hypothetical protein